jgi:hypothetical protein
MKLEQVVPWGRSLAEYRAMFSLSEADLQRRILGCGDGPASFNAEMTASGRPTVTSVDPLYAFEAADIARRLTEAERLVMAEVRTHAAEFKWSWFEDPEALLRARKQAMAVFLEDYERGKRQRRYALRTTSARAAGGRRTGQRGRRRRQQSGPGEGASRVPAGATGPAAA